MNYRKWNNMVVVFIVLPVLLLGLANYIIDPFDIFHSGFLKTPFQLNERYNKIEHLKKEHLRYNGYLLGSSRMGTTSPAMIERYIKDSHFYNLTVAGGTQFDNLCFVEYLLTHHFPIKYLYLQIDITDIYGYSAPKTNYSAVHHPEVQHRSKISFYLEHLTLLPLKNMLGKINVNSSSPTTPTMRYDLHHSGQWFLDHLENAIAHDHESYISQQITFKQKIDRSHEGLFYKKNVEALRKIKQLADKNHIKMIVFIAPHNHNMLNTFHTQSYLDYLHEIAQITPFWDFSGYNTITNDNHHYYEMAHSRPNVSELIAARIFNDNHIHLPADFGQYVTTHNIDGYLMNRKIQIAVHDAENVTSV